MNFSKDLNSPALEQIKKAYEGIRKYAHRTPLMSSRNINSITGANIIFKCENFQRGGAFKIRGALNAVYSNLDEHRRYGITTHSSGNHAQAVAIAGSMAGIKVHLVMPETSPKVKINAVRSYGAEIEFCKPTLKDRERTMDRLIADNGYKPIHAYNDIRVITGQATASLEFFEQLDCELDYLITPVGGGGLLSGTCLTSSYVSPDTKIIGAEPEMANDAYLSFKRKQFVPAKSPKTIADGLRTSLGSLTFPVILDKASDILVTGENSIIDSMKLIWERMKIVIEPSSAVALAVIIDNPGMFKNKNTGVIITGGNVDLMNLPWIDKKQ